MTKTKSPHNTLQKIEKLKTLQFVFCFFLPKDKYLQKIVDAFIMDSQGGSTSAINYNKYP